jgi:hypothetical protein
VPQTSDRIVGQYLSLFFANNLFLREKKWQLILWFEWGEYCKRRAKNDPFRVGGGKTQAHNLPEADCRSDNMLKLIYLYLFFLLGRERSRGGFAARTSCVGAICRFLQTNVWRIMRLRG